MLEFSASFDPTGKKCRVSGWGREASKGPKAVSPKKLRETYLRVLEDPQCAMVSKALSRPWDPQTNSMICAGGKDKDACQVCKQIKTSMSQTDVNYRVILVALWLATLMVRCI